MKTKFTFTEGSLRGLNETVTLYARTFIEAKEKVLKCICLGRTGKMLHECANERSDYWGE